MTTRSPLGVLLLLAGCATSQPAPQGISLTPEAGNPDMVAIAAQASDDVGVVYMGLLIDGKVVKTCGPCTSIAYNWNLKKVPPGPHVIAVEARDAAGNAGRDSITVTRR